MQEKSSYNMCFFFGVLRSVNGGKWVGKRWEMPISLYLLYLKALKALKSVCARIFFGGKYVFFLKKQTLCRPNRAALSPLNPPSGGTQHR